MSPTPKDKRCTEDDAVAELRSGMTIGFGASANSVATVKARRLRLAHLSIVRSVA